ncbi:MAG TPA: hypothetical protein VL068_11725 [Microthrixaceae bacterium]|nr:hypothetical protein [Microthrixaceae bacterium]
MERTGTPSLLPILRSRQQAELLTDVLDNSDRELSLTDLSKRLAIPAASVHREIERAEAAGLVRSRRIGNTRLVSANPNSPYFEPLRQLLVQAFGVRARLIESLAEMPGIDEVYIFGSWAASWHGNAGDRPVGDIDVLVMGDVDRDELYAAMHAVSEAIGREVQTQIRPAGWIKGGSGSFHETIVARPMVKVLP